MADTRSDILEQLLAETDWLPRMARRLVPAADLADDVSQQTWLAALRSPPTHASNPRAWLATVARRTVAKMSRAQRRREAREQISRPPVVETDPARLAARVEMQRRVAAAVLSLAEPYRSTIVMRFFEDRTSAEIAAAVGIPAATVRTRLRRALADLRRRLDDEHEGDRRAWIAPLLPFLGNRPDSFAKHPALAATGALLMSVKTWIVLTVAALIAVTAASLPTFGTAVPPEGPAVEPPPPVGETAQAEPAKPLAEKKKEKKTGAVAIRGRILDARSQPVANARVEIVRGPKEFVTRGLSEKDGRYVIVAPPEPGDVDFVVSAPGFVPLIRPLDEVLAEAGGDLDLVLSRGKTITGHLRDETGQPVATAIKARRVGAESVPFQVRSRFFPHPPSHLGRSDETGRFEISGLTTGRYRLEKATFNYRDGEGSKTTVEAGASGVELVFYRAVALTIRIHHAGTEHPVKDPITWKLFHESGLTMGGQTTGGTPVARGLLDGRWRLVVTGKHYRTWEKELHLDLDESNATVDVPLVATAGHGVGTLRGKVVPPVAGTRVFVAEMEHLMGYPVDMSGCFEIGNVPSGTYHLRAVGPEGDRATPFERVVLRPGGSEDVTLRSETAGAVAVRLTAGKGCREMPLELHGVVQHGVFGPRYFVRPGVSFEIPLVPGPVRLLVIACGRILGEASTTVVADQSVDVEIALRPTADGAPDAPPVPTRVERPRPPQRKKPLPPVPVAEGAPAEVVELVAKLTSPDGNERLRAAKALGERGGEAAVGPLLHLLQNDPGLFVQRIAIIGLGRIGRPALETVPAIAPFLRDEGSWLADAASQAIVRIAGRPLTCRKGMTEKEIVAAAKKLVEAVRKEK